MVCIVICLEEKSIENWNFMISKKHTEKLNLIQMEVKAGRGTAKKQKQTIPLRFREPVLEKHCSTQRWSNSLALAWAVW